MFPPIATNRISFILPSDQVCTKHTLTKGTCIPLETRRHVDCQEKREVKALETKGLSCLLRAGPTAHAVSPSTATTCASPALQCPPQDSHICCLQPVCHITWGRGFGYPHSDAALSLTKKKKSILTKSVKQI